MESNQVQNVRTIHHWYMCPAYNTTETNPMGASCHIQLHFDEGNIIKVSNIFRMELIKNSSNLNCRFDTVNQMDVYTIYGLPDLYHPF